MKIPSPFSSELLLSRELLDQSLHVEVDLILKDLKIHSRRLQAALSIQLDETRILERLYYKGKNQHRGALFWRRFVELRRYSYRLQKADLAALMDNLRYAFFGSNVNRKGSWTHVPNHQAMSSTIQKLTLFMALLRKIEETTQHSCNHFVFSMHSGAFLQFILLLTSVAARTRAVTLELMETSALLLSTLNRASFLVMHTFIIPQPSDPTREHQIKREDLRENIFISCSSQAELENLREECLQYNGTMSRIVIERSKMEHSEPLTSVQSTPLSRIEVKSKKHLKKKSKGQVEDEIDKIFEK